MYWIIAALILLLATVLIVFICYAYRVAFYMPPVTRRHDNLYDLPRGAQYEKERDRMRDLIAAMEPVCYEEVYLTAKDGVRLFARYYHSADGAPLQIQFHGYRGAALRDFCGGNKLARDAGHNTLVVDQRAHGKSEGRAIAFGVKEREDCLLWARYARERFGDVPIFLSGVSMGAATVLMASELPLPENVVGIIADCPYSSPEAIIRRVCRHMHMPPRLVFPFIRFSARLFARFDVTSCSAVTAVRNTKLPILLLHGEDDRFVPVDMSREIYDAAAGEKNLYTFPGAGHGLSYLVDTESYKKAVDDFIRACITRSCEKKRG